MGDRPLTFGIDAHALGKRQTGNERFTANLIRGLRSIAPHHELVLYVERDRDTAEWRDDPGVHVRTLRPPDAPVRLAWHLPRGPRRDDLDALIVQYVGPVRSACPVFAVVHDVAFAVHPEHAPPLQRIWTRRLIPWTMRRAEGVITVSAFSRSEIARVFGIDPERITVAPNAVDPVFAASSGAPGPVVPPYVLAIGNLQPRKNLITLIRAFRRLSDERPDLAERLVIVGQPAYRGSRIVEEARDLVARGRVVFTGYLSDPPMASALAAATLFAHPSTYEGFGLPLIEAMACGAPVVASDIPVVREVAGEAAALVPPLDPGAWAATLGRLLDDGGERARLAERGRARARAYTPEASAAPVVAAIERAVGVTPAADDAPPSASG